MKEKLQESIAKLSNEIQALDFERKALARRDSEIEVRLHQVVGAIYELQRIIADLDRQSSAEVAAKEQVDQSIHLSENGDQDNHQVQLKETETNSQKQS